jgi:hypothetical protein
LIEFCGGTFRSILPEEIVINTITWKVVLGKKDIILTAVVVLFGMMPPRR